MILEDGCHTSTRYQFTNSKFLPLLFSLHVLFLRLMALSSSEVNENIVQEQATSQSQAIHDI